MGAQEFWHTAKGKTAQEAFNNAREEALYDYGHSGYSGTIAEKDSFKVIPCEQKEEAVDAKMKQCMENENHFVQNKWGDAGCIKVRDGVFVFFGWASS